MMTNPQMMLFMKMNSPWMCCAYSEGPLSDKSPSCASCKSQGVAIGRKVLGVAKKRLPTFGEDLSTSLLIGGWRERSPLHNISRYVSVMTVLFQGNLSIIFPQYSLLCARHFLDAMEDTEMSVCKELTTLGKMIKSTTIKIIIIIIPLTDILLFPGSALRLLQYLVIWTSLVVQWSRLHASTARGVGSIPGGELRSCRPCD